MIDAVRRALARPPIELVPTNGFSAVAAIFDPDLHLLLIRRAEHPRDPWSGHVSFPGGRMEPGDPDALATAVRETREEIGLDLPPHTLVGQLDDLAAIGGRPGMVIRPFVFRVDTPLGTFATNEEVASIHRIALGDLLADDGRGRMTLEYKGAARELACVDFDGQRLWGLTLRMVDDLLDRLDGRGTGLERIGLSNPPGSR